MAININEDLSVIAASGVKNLPDGDYDVNVSSFDGSVGYGIFPAKFVGGAAEFVVKCQPFQDLRCNILTGEYPAEKSATFTAKANMACYTNGAILTNNKVIKDPAYLAGAPYTLGNVFIHSNGIGITFSTQGSVSMCGQGLGDHLAAGEMLSFELPVEYTDLTEETLKFYILGSEQVGSNLVSGNSDVTPISGLTAGKVYEIAFSVEGRTVGGIAPQLVGDSTNQGDYSLELNGREMWHIRAPSNVTSLELIRSGGHDGTVNGLHLKEVLTSGAAAKLDSFEVVGGTGEIEVDWLPTPIGGFLSDVEPVDEAITGYVGSGTWYQTIDGAHAIRFMSGESASLTSPVSAPANTAWTIRLVYGFDNSDYGRPFGNKSDFSSRILIFPDTRIFRFSDRDGTNFDMTVEAYDTNPLQEYILTCTDTGELTVTKDGKHFGSATGVTAGFSIDRIHNHDDEAALSEGSYSELEIEVNGVQRLHLSAEGSNKTQSAPIITDISSSNNNATSRNMSLIPSYSVGYHDTKGVYNLKADDVVMVAKQQGIRRESGSRDVVTGYTEIKRARIIGGYTGAGADSQRGIIAGSNSDGGSGPIMIAGNRIDLLKTSNLNNYDENSDPVVMNSTHLEARHASRAFSFCNNLRGGSDGQEDFKVRNDMYCDTLVGGLAALRIHSYSVVHGTGLILDRNADTRTCININYPTARVILENCYADGVRCHDFNQMIAFKNPHENASFTAEGAVYGWDSTTPASGLTKQLYIAKTKIRKHKHCDFAITDYELERSEAGADTWERVPLDSFSLQGVVGSPYRKLPTPSGLYDFRIRTVWGNKFGEWKTVNSVEVA